MLHGLGRRIEGLLRCDRSKWLLKHGGGHLLLGCRWREQRLRILLTVLLERLLLLRILPVLLERLLLLRLTVLLERLLLTLPVLLEGRRQRLRLNEGVLLNLMLLEVILREGLLLHILEAITIAHVRLSTV